MDEKQRLSVCLLNDSFPPVIDGVANAVLNYARVIQEELGSTVVAVPDYPGTTDAYPFPVIRYPSFDTTKIVGYRAGYPFSPRAMGALADFSPDIIHTHCPVMSAVMARALRERILESYRRLPNGANAAWYEQTALEYEGVAAARAVGRARGTGTVDVYVTTEAGLPGAELLAGLQAVLQEKREIAVDVQVKAPTVQTVNVAVSLLPAEGTDFETAQAAAEQVLTTFFTGRLLGEPVLLAELGCRLYSLPEVENYRFTAPAADVAASDTVLPVLGTLAVTEMET